MKTGGHLAEAAYRDGLYILQSQILDGALATTTPEGHWSVAPNMITAPDSGVRDGTRTRTVMGHLPLLFPTGVSDSGELAPISNEYLLLLYLTAKSLSKNIKRDYRVFAA